MYRPRLIRKCQQFSSLLLLFMLLLSADRPLLSVASLVNGSSSPSFVLPAAEQQQSEGTAATVAVTDEAAPPGEQAFITPQQQHLPTLSEHQSPPLSSSLPSATVAIDVHQQQHPHPKRNYASKDCGAKVLYSNAEAENRGAILNDPERDDYMRNPCERAQNKFLIIELCETIQPTALEIANFELFSSSPRQFRLWGSERYPTQEWALIGEFEALDNREVQLFNVLEHTSYSKFVKLELLTHYGMEHYCTLSTFRLYGTSMVDEYEAETGAAVVDALQQQQHLDSVFGRTFTTLQPTNSAAPVPAAENGILVNEEEKEKQQDINNNTTTTAQQQRSTMESASTNVIHRPSNQSTAAQRCHKCSQSFSSQCDWFCHAFFGPYLTKNQSTARQTSRPMMATSSTRAALKTSNSLVEFLNQISPNRFAVCAAAHIPRQHICALTEETQKAEKGPNAAQKNPQVEHKQQQQQQSTQLPTTETTNNDNNNNINNLQNDAEKRDQKQQQHQASQAAVQQPQQIIQQPHRPMLDAKVVEKSNLSPLPGTSSTHKESVFMKLNKRLTLLEQNMSLSSEHLLELSKRCVSGTTRAESELKQQREGIAREAERMAKQEANRVETEMKQKIAELQREVRRLSQQLQSVQTTVVQATGTGGFFYRPMLSAVHGYKASDSHCRTEQACLVSDAMIGTTFPPLHSTSAAPYGSSSMPVSAVHNAFEEKPMDGLWTTSQVLYLMLVVQLGTLVVLKLFRALFARALHQCSSSTAAQTLKAPAAATPLTPLSLPTATANLTASMPNTSPHSLPLLNSSTLC